jgi:hypothetical protein
MHTIKTLAAASLLFGTGLWATTMTRPPVVLICQKTEDVAEDKLQLACDALAQALAEIAPDRTQIRDPDRGRDQDWVPGEGDLALTLHLTQVHPMQITASLGWRIVGKSTDSGQAETMRAGDSGPISLRIVDAEITDDSYLSLMRSLVHAEGLEL